MHVRSIPFALRSAAAARAALARLIVFTLAAAAPAVAQEAPWQGCWQAADGGETLWFEGTRCGWLRAGEPTFQRVTPTADGVRLERWARLESLRLQVEGNTLVVSGAGGARTLTRTDEVPRALLVEPYALPDVPVDPDTVASVTQDLRARRAEDQRVRSAATPGADPGEHPGEDPGEMTRVDEDNTQFLRGLILELGWIDAGRFGVEAADAAFLIVQHSADLRLMRTALPRIEVDVRAGRLGGQAFALLHDRLQLHLGYLQRYGSQIGVTADGVSVLMPCEDLATVDERRASLGMGPLAEYLALFRGADGAPVRPLEEAP